jgi:hypothetical protein
MELTPTGVFALLDLASESVVLDLSRVTFVLPQSVVAIATWAERVCRGGRSLRVVSPASEETANYLSRVHLPELFSELGVVHDLPVVHERRLGRSIVELTRFTGATEVRELADSVHEFAVRHDRVSADALHTAICEAGENVVTHAGIDHGFAVAQFYPQQRVFRFALGDSGIGYFGSLQSQGATDLEHGLEMAVTVGVTSTGDPGRGLGLPAIRDELFRLGGVMTIGDGAYARIYSPDSRDGRRAASSTGSIVGSILYAKFRVAAPSTP